MVLLKLIVKVKSQTDPEYLTIEKKSEWLQLVIRLKHLNLRVIKLEYHACNTCKRWFRIDSLFIPIPSNLNFAALKELRILPRNRCLYWEFIYEKEVVVKPQLNQENVLGIDHGLNNWLTCVSNVGTSLIVDGKHIKSMNRWYNKQISNIKENKPQGFWSNRLAAITEKRNRQLRDGINKAARIVINHCARK